MSRGVPAFGAKTGGIPELLEESVLFSNSRRNIDEICFILKSLNKEIMREQAIRNFNEAKNYDYNIIEKNRRKILEKFILDVNNNHIV